MVLDFTSEDNLLTRRRFSVIDGCPTRYAMMQRYGFDGHQMMPVSMD